MFVAQKRKSDGVRVDSKSPLEGDFKGSFLVVREIINWSIRGSRNYAESTENECGYPLGDNTTPKLFMSV